MNIDIEETIELLSKVGDGLLERREELIEADLSAGFTYAGSSRLIDKYAHSLKNSRKALKYVGNRKGVCHGMDEEVAMVLPFNFTVGISTLISCQMLVGNNIRLRSAKISQRSYRVLESIWTRHFPGRVRFDFSDNARQFMTTAFEDPKVKVVGSYGVEAPALQYKDLVRKSGKPYYFEGPGKNPAIILEDADPIDAAQQVFNLRFLRNAGQICISPGRFYVHEEVLERFSNTLIELLKKDVVVGDPRDPKTTIGPLGSERAAGMIEEQLKDAVAKGAKVIHGGHIEGKKVPPTVVVSVNHQMTGMQEESFGPICWLMPFKTTDEAIKLAKDNRYGLGATIFGEKDALKVKAALKGEDYLHEVDDFVFGKFGMVEINPAKALADPEFLERLEYNLVGGYGYSGWLWTTEGGKFKIKQGPKSFALETSVKV